MVSLADIDADGYRARFRSMGLLGRRGGLSRETREKSAEASRDRERLSRVAPSRRFDEGLGFLSASRLRSRIPASSSAHLL